MRVNSFQICLLLISAYLLLPIFPHPIAAFSVAGVDSGGNGSVPVSDGPTVRKDERWPLVSSDFGEISAVRVSDGGNGSYYLQFITLNPNALFLPVYRHSHMLFYVTSGSGTLSWINIEKDGGNLNEVMLQRGDIYGLSPKTIFYLKNDVQKLEIYAIFPNSEVELENAQIGVGAYIGVPDLVLGFDDQVLQSTLGVGGGDKRAKRSRRQPLIVEGEAGVNTNFQGGLGSWGIRALLRIKNNIFMVENNKKASNIFDIDREVDNCFGWAVTVSRKDSDALKHTDFGVFMVNLSKGSMMAPHWNPKTDEISIVVQGAGMIQVVCPGIANETVCKNSRYIVQEGDVFVVPRYHAMVQTSFNNDTFVSVGFKLALKKERSQYLIGKFSILKMLDRTMLQKSFNVMSTTIDLILSPTKREVILKCTSCSEEEEATMEREEAEQEEGGGGESPEGGGGESLEEGGGGDGGGGGGGGESPEGGGGEGGDGETPEGGGDGESPEGGGGESPEEGGGGEGGGGGGETTEGGGGESPEEGGGGKGGAGETPEGQGGESPEEGGRGEPSEEGGESPGGGGGESPEEGSGAEGGGELPGEGGGGGSGGGGESTKEGGGGESPEEGGGGGESHEEGGGGEGKGEGESQEEGGGGGGESPKEVGRGGGAGEWELSGEGGSGGGESPQEGGAGGRGGWDLPEEGGGGDRGWLPFEGDDSGAKLPEEKDRGGVEVQKEGRGGGGRSDLPGRGGEGDSRGELPTEGGGGRVLLGGGLALKEG